MTSSDKDKVYDLRLKDLPQEDKPREKMLLYGSSALSLIELMAVVLNVGTRTEDVLSISRRIIKEYGVSAISSQFDPRQLSEDLNIPIVKACQIIACSEIGRRLYKKSDAGLIVIRTAKDAYEYLRDMHSLPKEQLRGIYLDTHNRIIHDEVISIGTINTNIVHPREVFRPALEYGAVAVVLAHNHPSGIVEPSTADIEVTKQLIQAGRIIGIHLLEQVVVTKDGFQSIDVDYK